MSLTNDEQDALRGIEHGLRRDDPLLADRFADPPTLDRRRRSVVFAQRMMTVGAVLTLLGLIAADGLISLGAILCGYGLLVFLIAACAAVRNCTWDKGRPGWRWRA